MQFITKTKIKIWLICLCGLITANVIFVSSKSYSVNSINDSGAYSDKLICVSEMQYISCLSSLPFTKQTYFISETKISYLFGLPEKTLYLIYLGYFIIAWIFILSIKLNIK
jgi:hypothetical protein